MLNPTQLIDRLCLKDVDIDSNLVAHTYTHNTYAYTRKPCSGAYYSIAESSVARSVDTIDYR